MQSLKMMIMTMLTVRGKQEQCNAKWTAEYKIEYAVETHLEKTAGCLQWLSA